MTSIKMAQITQDPVELWIAEFKKRHRKNHDVQSAFSALERAGCDLHALVPYLAGLNFAARPDVRKTKLRDVEALIKALRRVTQMMTKVIVYSEYGIFLCPTPVWADLKAANEDFAETLETRARQVGRKHRQWTNSQLEGLRERVRSSVKKGASLSNVSDDIDVLAGAALNTKGRPVATRRRVQRFQKRLSKAKACPA